jgi:hypothetical protein
MHYKVQLVPISVHEQNEYKSGLKNTQSFLRRKTYMLANPFLEKKANFLPTPSQLKVQTSKNFNVEK